MSSSHSGGELSTADADGELDDSVPADENPPSSSQDDESREDEEEERASLSTLPVELLFAILGFLSHKSLRRVLLLNRHLHSIAKQLLLHQPHFSSIDTFTAFLDYLEQDKVKRWEKRRNLEETAHILDLAACVQHVRLKLVRKIGAPEQRGAHKLKRLGICRNLKSLTVIGPDDFRLKHLAGNGSLRVLSIGNTSFRAHSQPTGPMLLQTLSTLTELTLSNVGFPSSSHFIALLDACSATLTSLSLSAIRDIQPEALTEAFCSLQRGAGALRHLRIKNLTSPQSDILPTILQTLALETVEFTSPLASFEQLINLPTNLKMLRLLRREGESPEVDLMVLRNLERVVKVGHSKKWESIKVWPGAVKTLSRVSGAFESTFLSSTREVVVESVAAEGDES